jgi:hypothetical protein
LQQQSRFPRWLGHGRLVYSNRAAPLAANKENAVNRLAWIALIPALTFACSIQGPEGEQTQDARDGIVGGSATSSLPAVGALIRFGSTHCTGTLISARRVVTAAHCLQGVSASSLRFAIGPNAAQPEFSLAVASVTAHPQYNSSQLTNDIGYVDLAENAPVAPMRVLTSMDSSFVGQEFVFVGYGVSNGFSQTGAGTKRFVNMAISQVMAKQFRYQVPNKNTCNGDSGGPAFAQVNGELFVAGVTSYGDANCVQYGVDTRTDTYIDFLGIGSEPADPCGGETFEGRCDNKTVVWCESGQVQNQICASNKICGFDNSKQYFACIDPPQDPCEGETFEGRCQNNAVIYCENSQKKTIQCGGNRQCGFDSAKGFYNCL